MNGGDMLSRMKIVVIICRVRFAAVVKEFPGHWFRCMLDLRKYFFSEGFRIVDRWNSLDEDTVSACSLNQKWVLTIFGLNSFENRLAKLKQKRKGFFISTSPWTHIVAA